MPPWQRREWAPPTTYTLLLAFLASGVLHFCWIESRAGWRAFRGDELVRAAAFTSSARVSEHTLLLVRTLIFSWCFFILSQSSFYEGPGCLRFFTVWNFIALTIYFGIGAGLSCSCCRHLATHGPITPDHRWWAGLHRLLFELELPMSVLVAMVVWLAIYPNAVAVAAATGDASGQIAVLSLTSITMHALNVIFMLVEFSLNALFVEPWHVGLVVAWGSLYGVFNGLQANFTGDTVYFFMDFSVMWMPATVAGLTAILLLLHSAICLLSKAKHCLLWDDRMRDHLQPPPEEADVEKAADDDDGGDDGRGGSADAYRLWKDDRPPVQDACSRAILGCAPREVSTRCLLALLIAAVTSFSLSRPPLTAPRPRLRPAPLVSAGVEPRPEASLIPPRPLACTGL
jgi:hypothetical protein